MPQKTVKGDDGRDYIELPGGVRIPADELKESQGDAPTTMGGKIARGAYNVLTNPEVVGGASAFLAPETGGLSMAIPSLVGAGTSVARDLYEGQRDPKTIASNAALHGGLNLLPGVLGAGRRLMMGGRMGDALASAAEGPGWTGTIAKGLHKLMAPAAEPEVEAAAAKMGRTKQITQPITGIVTQPAGRMTFDPNAAVPAETALALLKKKLLDPNLNTMAKAQVLQAMQRLEASAGSKVANGLRGVMGAASATYDQAKGQ